MSSSSAERVRRFRQQKKMTPSTELEQLRSQTAYHKKRVRETTKRLEDKNFDDKMKELNRSRVQKYRQKKRFQGLPNNEILSQAVALTSVSVSEQSSTLSSPNPSPNFSSYSPTETPSSNQSSVTLTGPTLGPSSERISPTFSGSNSSPSSGSVLFPSSGSISPPSSGSISRPSIDLADLQLSDRLGEKGRRSTQALIVKLPTPKSRQHKQGEKRRRDNLKDKNDSLEELHDKVRVLEADQDSLEAENLSLLKDKIELERKLGKKMDEKTDQFKWFKIIWQHFSPEIKKEVKSALQVAKEELPAGTLRGLRDNANINFSNPLPPSATSRGSGDLKKKVEEFAVNNSFEVPDKKMAKKKMRYMRHLKTVLYHQFLMENPELECHYSTFCTHFPFNIVKPGINSHGSCLCEDCENFGLKEEAIKREKLLTDSGGFNVDNVIRLARDGNRNPEEEYLKTLEEIKTGDNKDKIVTYFVWEEDKQTVQDKNDNATVRKRMVRKNIRVTAAGLAARTLQAYGPLKEHLNRDQVIKKYIRNMRQKAIESDEMVCLTVDWSENGVLITPGEVQTGYYGRASYSIHSGYLYMKDNQYGFAMVTDENDHKAESVWAALTPKLEILVSQGIKKVVISSDSTSSQYRNCKNVFYIKHFCVKYKVEMVWIFTEKHHGKSPADGIGGNIKNTVDQLAAFNTQHNIQNAKDVTDLLRSTDTSIEVTHFKKEDIIKTLNLIPGVLNSFRGAMKIHEIFVNENGVIRVKQLPTDEHYNLINITVRNRRARGGVGRGGVEEAIARVSEE